MQSYIGHAEMFDKHFEISAFLIVNKRIEDDTKAAARQSAICIKKLVRQQDAYLAIRPAYPRGVVHGPLKGTKHICNRCFYKVIFGVDLLMFRPDIAYKRPNFEKKTKLYQLCFGPPCISLRKDTPV